MMADAEKTLRDLLDKILDERNYRPRVIEVKAIAATGTNYTSTLFTVNVTAPNKDDLNLFAKVACIGDGMRVTMHADWLFKTERTVYTELAKIYEDIQNETNVPEEHRFSFPKFYGHNPVIGKETVIMEDLTAAGFETYDRYKSVDWDHASVAVENLAKFHALSFAFQKYRPDRFEKMIPDMKSQIGTMEGEPDEAMIAIWTAMVDNALEVINPEYRERVRNYSFSHNLWEKYNKPIGKPIIAHGDYRLSNLLFKTQNGVLQSIAVDYQTVHAGCPAGDLIYFIFLGSDEEFRREHYQRLLDHYYSSLERALERLAVDPSVYTREKFDSDIKELLPYAVLMGVSVLPVVTVDVESAPRVEGDADVSSFAVKPNRLFAERFSGIVNDCIRWGAI